MLFGAKTWVVTRMMILVLEGAHRNFAQEISGRRPDINHRKGRWV